MITIASQARQCEAFYHCQAWRKEEVEGEGGVPSQHGQPSQGD